MTIRTILALATALLLAACNPGAQLDGAEQQIKQFQADYNKGDAAALYKASGETLRNVTTPEQMESMVTLFATRLGKIESTERTGFNAGFHNGTATTTVVMQTRFEQGEGTETYIFEGSGEDMKLAGWNVNSPLLNLSPEDVKKLTETSADE